MLTPAPRQLLRAKRVQCELEPRAGVCWVASYHSNASPPAGKQGAPGFTRTHRSDWGEGDSHQAPLPLRLERKLLDVSGGLKPLIQQETAEGQSPSSPDPTINRIREAESWWA